MGNSNHSYQSAAKENLRIGDKPNWAIFLMGKQKGKEHKNRIPNLIKIEKRAKESFYKRL
jgi:hypothetical protein